MSTLIVRQAPGPAHDFTILPNSVIRDRRLSYRARGLLADLSSHRDGHRIDSREMAAQNPEGRDAIRTAMNELIEFHYMTRSRERLPSGKWAMTIVIYPYGNAPVDTPAELLDRAVDNSTADRVGFPGTGSNRVGFPGTGLPGTGFPGTNREDQVEDQVEDSVVTSVGVSPSVSETVPSSRQRVTPDRARPAVSDVTEDEQRTANKILDATFYGRFPRKFTPTAEHPAWVRVAVAADRKGITGSDLRRELDHGGHDSTRWNGPGVVVKILERFVDAHDGSRLTQREIVDRYVVVDETPAADPDGPGRAAFEAARGRRNAFGHDALPDREAEANDAHVDRESIAELAAQVAQRFRMPS